jgi:hypothetical protein
MQICNSTLGMEHPRKLGRNARRGEERVPNRRCGFCQTQVTTVGGGGAVVGVWLDFSGRNVIRCLSVEVGLGDWGLGLGLGLEI